MDEIYNSLIEFISKDKIFLNEPMSNHTSFKIGGNADIFIIVNTVDELKHVLKVSKYRNVPVTIIGNGSNILVRDTGIRGIVLKVNIQKLDIKYKENEVYTYIGAGELIGKAAQVFLKNSITGFEFASGIPGTFGGAIKMNAGAYGGEFKDIIESVTCMDYEGNIFELSNKECNFSYRHSLFSESNYIILEAKLKLQKGDSKEIKSKMDEYAKARKEKQPISMPSAGSTFKRGEDFITAKLIDECGLKGYTVGGAQISTMHAGFIVNTGDATAEDVLNLVDHVKEEVYKKFGKKIELEIQVLG